MTLEMVVKTLLEAIYSIFDDSGRGMGRDKAHEDWHARCDAECGNSSYPEAVPRRFAQPHSSAWTILEGHKQQRGLL